MDFHDNTFALLDGDDECDIAAIIKKVEAVQANPPPEPEKPKPSVEPARGGGRGDHGRGSERSGFVPNGVNGNRFSTVYGGDFNGRSRGRGGGRGERGQGFYEDRRFRNNDNNGCNGEAEGFKGKGYNGDENREFGRYGGRGRGGYFGFRGGEGRSFNGGRNGLNGWGVNDGNARAGWKRPETTEVAKDAEVTKGSAVQEISEDHSQKIPRSEEKKTEERRERRKKEWEEDAKKMTLAEYSKVLEEKRKALETNKVRERKVLVDEEFERMQLVDKKKKKEEEFIKGSGKEKLKKKDSLGKEDKLRKTLSIDEFLQPSEGQRYGLGRSSLRGSSTDGEGQDTQVEAHSASAVQRDPLQTEDPRQFPQLGKVGKMARQRL